jgi:hypothetical protein
MSSPMDPEQKYQLVIWFDKKQAGINELFRFVNVGLVDNVEKKVGYSTEGYLTLSLAGPLEEVDESHSRVIEFIKNSNWNLFRLIDTAGDEIRHQAYSELSKIEQELRVFINRVRNPIHADHEFRRMPITDSVSCRSVIPAMPIRSPGKKWEQKAG